MKYIILPFVFLGLTSVVSADEFADLVKALEAKNKRCDCSSPADCICGTREGDCTCGPCKAAKKVKLPKAPPLAMKHVCGCPSMSCNCAPLGGCHCSENAMFNRVNPTWRAESDGWSCWRGAEQIGYLKDGVYHPLHNGEWCEPCKPPIPLPTQRSESRVASAPAVCRS